MKYEKLPGDVRKSLAVIRVVKAMKYGIKIEGYGCNLC